MYKDLPTFNTQDELWHHGEVPDYFRRHALKIASFIGDLPEPILDLGEINPKIKIIQEQKGFSFRSLDDIDFDSDPIPGKWGTILCLEILEHLYGTGAEVEDNAVEIYIHRLRKKLSNQAIEIKTLRGLGYCLRKSP